MYDATIEERNKQEEAERTERLGKDKEEAMKLLRRRRADTAASEAASVDGAKRKIYSHPRCTKNVKKVGLCSTHGPACKRCEVGGCEKVAVQGGRCIAHGAQHGELCKAEYFGRYV